MKRFLFSFSVLFVLFISTTCWSQSEITIRFNENPFTYFAGTSEPDPNWYRPDFDDSSWLQDTGLIGFGYGFEDLLLPEGTRSLYMRYKFNVESKANFYEGNFFADFDDGYIAWLNGKEIVRVNVDKSVTHPAYDDITVRSHAMQVYEWDPYYPVLGYFLDSLQLDSTVVEGENTLAIQVLNDSIDGSDLQFLLLYFDITYADYNYYNWDSRYKKQCDLDSTTFPLVIANTDEWGIPSIPDRDIRRKAFMGIIDNGPGQYNHPDDSCNVYYGDVSIEVRGQSSSEYPKRSYRFEFIDSLENDSNVSVLGMPTESDWILMGPFHDKAQFRNTMVFDMGHMLDGSYQPRNRFCELIMNGEFLGLYSFMETIKRDADRVDISRLTSDEISGMELTGGFIIRYDKPGGWLQVVYPNESNLQPEQEEYIFDFVDEYKAVLRSNDFMDPNIGFRKYINDTSLVDHIIINEITKNADAYLYSTYMYKDRDDEDGRLHFGPLWDYDLAFGNSIFQQAYLTGGWQFDLWTNSTLSITRLFQDETLVDLFQERYHAAREGCLHTDSLLAYIDSMVVYLADAVERNYVVWPVIDKELFYPNYNSLTYEEEIWNIKNWLLDRLDWLDNNVDDIYYEVNYDNVHEIAEGWEFNYELYPNPFNEGLTVDIFTSRAGSIQFELWDMTGRRQYESSRDIEPGNVQIILNDSRLNTVLPGIYLMRIILDGNLVSTQRVIKQ